MDHIVKLLQNIFKLIPSNYNNDLILLKNIITHKLNTAENLTFLQQFKNQLLDLIKDHIQEFKNEKVLDNKKHKSIILNDIKQLIFDIYQDKIKSFENAKKIINKDKIFLPIVKQVSGLHPLTITMDKIYKIMTSMQFEWIDAPEVDCPENVFDKLNMDILHPAREDQQSFALQNHSEIPRTHCTNFQAKILDNWDEKNSLRYFHFGNVYRRDSDMTHTPKFKQFEVFFLDNKVANLSTLMGLIDNFFALFFGYKVETRIRTSFFPFTEISYEIDIKINNKWLEIGGCGIVHENVFKFNNKQKARAWAWGMGIERLTMIAGEGKYTDIRKFYQNDVRGY